MSKESKKASLDRWTVILADCLQNYGRATKEQYVITVGKDMKDTELFKPYLDDKLSKLVEDKCYGIYLSIYKSAKNQLLEHGYDDSRESFEMLYTLPNIDLLMSLPEEQLKLAVVCD